MTPTRLRQIAQQLENNCSAYQEKITQFGYMPCKTCVDMGEELRRHAIALQVHGPLIELAGGANGDEQVAAELAELTESTDPQETEPAKA